jgi:hypothetical protein
MHILAHTAACVHIKHLRPTHVSSISTKTRTFRYITKLNACTRHIYRFGSRSSDKNVQHVKTDIFLTNKIRIVKKNSETQHNILWQYYKAETHKLRKSDARQLSIQIHNFHIQRNFNSPSHCNQNLQFQKQAQFSKYCNI